MSVSEQNWKRKEYETWDEAFRGLAPVIRQQSVRVAAYTQVLFVGACASNFGRDTAEGRDRMRGQYADLAYKCGLYHQLGKALVPPEYQIWQRDFTDEEQAVYRKYTTDGRTLVAALQERGSRAKGKRTGEMIEQPTKNIPWLMLRESCEQHMERWDGTGYPAGRSGNRISPIALIVGLAKELDRLCAETKSEDPFSEAFQAVVEQADVAWPAELIQVLRDNREKCEEVFVKYIHYTRALPRTIPLVRKRKDRPMGLKYRPMVCDAQGTVRGYEATPWFGGIADRPGETETGADVEQLLSRTGLITDMSFYLLYEAADALLRLENCKIATAGILVQMLPAFYQEESKLDEMDQLFVDQPIAREKLMLTVPERVLLENSAHAMATVRAYAQNGIALVLENYHPQNISLAQLQNLGITRVRLAPELYVQQETAQAMRELRSAGIHLLAGSVAEHDTLLWLLDGGTELASGPLTGVECDEDDIIRDALAKERWRNTQGA